jgi:nucleotide-binding universal stress UspA family protein
MTKPIIVAADVRREDIAPARLGMALARLLDAPVVLATAYPVDLAIENLYPEYAVGLGRAADRAVELLARSAREPAIVLTTTAVPTGGSPARALHELAEREGAQLLVIGSSERGPVGRVSPTAVTDRLLHGAPCPVAVAPAGFAVKDAERPQLIGVAFTDTPDGRAALAFSGALATRTSARLRVFSVAEPPSPLVAGTVDALALDYERQAHLERAKTALERASDELSHLPSVSCELLSGHAPEALAAVSGELDLLVCGSRGYGPVRTVLLGGTSHVLVRTAACPVVVVPLGERDARNDQAAVAALEDSPNRR